MKTILCFLDYLFPLLPSEDEMQGYYQKRIIQVGFTLIILFFLSMAILTYVNSNTENFYLATLSLVLCLLAPLIYRKSQSYSITINYTLIVVLPGLIYRSYTFGGINSPTLVTWATFPIIVTTFTGLLSQYFWNIFFIFLAISFDILSRVGLIPPSTFSSELTANILFLSLIVTQIFIFGVIYFYRSLLTRSQSKLKAQVLQDSALIRTISHDVSTPITIIINYLQRLKVHSTQYEPAYLEAINIKNLIDKIRTNEAIESGKIKNDSLEMVDQDLEKFNAHQLFKYTNYISNAIWIFLSIFYSLTGSPNFALLFAIIAIVTYLSLYIEKWTKSTIIAANFVMFFVTISSYFRIKMMGGFLSPALLLLPLLPGLLSFVLPMIWTFFWVVIYFLISLNYFIQFKLGESYQTSLSENAIQNYKVISVIILILVFHFLTNYFKKIQGQYVSNINFLINKKNIVIKTLTNDILMPTLLIKEIINRETTKTPEMNKIIKACNQITQIVNSVNKLNQQSENAEFHLKEIFDEILFLNSEKLEAKNMKINIQSVEPLQSIYIFGDKTIFTYEIINNIITNSIKFTPNNSKDLRIDVNIQFISIGKVQISIKDFGIGIPQEILNKIFDHNAQTTRVGQSGEKGTGFGMPILNDYVAKFQGKLNITSQTIDKSPQDHGTTTTLEFNAALK